MSDYTKLCTAKYICQDDPRIESWSVDMSSDKSLDNWQGRLDLICEESWKVGLLGSAIFVGWASTLLWVPRFGDLYGRKTVFALGMSLNLVLYVVMLWTRDIDVMLVSLFLQGALTSVRMNIGYLYMLELMP